MDAGQVISGCRSGDAGQVISGCRSGDKWMQVRRQVKWY